MKLSSKINEETFKDFVDENLFNFSKNSSSMNKLQALSKIKKILENNSSSADHRILLTSALEYKQYYKEFPAIRKIFELEEPPSDEKVKHKHLSLVEQLLEKFQ